MQSKVYNIDIYLKNNLLDTSLYDEWHYFISSRGGIWGGMWGGIWGITEPLSFLYHHSGDVWVCAPGRWQGFIDLEGKFMYYMQFKASFYRLLYNIGLTSFMKIYIDEWYQMLLLHHIIICSFEVFSTEWSFKYSKDFLYYYVNNTKRCNDSTEYMYHHILL